jgi:DNA modification methylase
MARKSTFGLSTLKAGRTRRRPGRARLRSAATKICRALAAAQVNDLAIFEFLRTAGATWVDAKELLASSGMKIDDWARDNLPVSRQWMDRHEELFRRWDEFLLAMAWADQLPPWEPDRKPSLHKAFDMMDAKRRYDSFTTATAGALGSTTLPAAKLGKLDVSQVDFLLGDALEVLRPLPSSSVDTCVTSPPYWGAFRNYGDDKQIGWEPDPEAYIARLIPILVEVLRVLKPGGTLWLVMGDAYASPGGKWTAESDKLMRNALRGTKQKGSVPAGMVRAKTEGIRGKNLLLMAARVALAFQAAGAVLRAEIIWDKATVRPESVKDRPTRSHEMIYLFSKQPEYCYDADAIREPLAKPLGYRAPNRKAGVTSRQREKDYTRRWGNSSGRNARTLWRLRSKPYHGNHPAPFPIELPERCLKATLPQGGVVIDPFGGAGTTAIAALRLGASKVILIDVNRSYLDEARERIENTNAPNHAPTGEPILLGQHGLLHPGDCRDILAAIPDNSVDLITVDPPYWMRVPKGPTPTDFHRQNNGQKPRIQEVWDEFHSVDDYLEFTEIWLSQLIRVLDAKGSLFIFANQHNLGLINYVLQRLGIQFVNQIVWRKPNGVPNLTCRRLQCRHEVIIWAIKGTGYRFNYKAVKAQEYPDKRAGVQMNDVWLQPTVRRDEAVGHSTQKPVALYERLLEMCGLQGGTLLDPMAGSGTAAIAAARWGMRAILIERDASYVEMIQRRWEDFVAQQQPPANDNEPKTGPDPNGESDTSG